MLKHKPEHKARLLPQRYFVHSSKDAVNTLTFNANTYLDRIDGEYVKVELKHISYGFTTNAGAGQALIYTIDASLEPFGLNETSTSTSPNVLHLMAGDGKDNIIYNFHSDGERGVCLVLHKNDILRNNGQLVLNLNNFKAYGATVTVWTPLYFEAILEVTTIEHISSLVAHP